MKVPNFYKNILVLSNNFSIMPNYSKIAGTLLFIGGIQFVIALFIAEALYPSYSIANNYISDLGVWGTSSANVFNPSVMLFGATVLASAYFIQKHFKRRTFSVLVAIAGAGTLGVGIFPENTFVVNGIPVLHSLSALLAFVVGGINAVAIFKITKGPFRYLSVILGVVALSSVVLFIATHGSGGLGVGAGGMERLMTYPTVLGLIGLGGYLLGSANEK
jgi:hypothetical membrane protein